MNRNVVILVLGIATVLSSAVLLAGVTSAWVVALTGFFFVVGGTLLTTIVSENFQRVVSVLRTAPTVFSEVNGGLGEDRSAFLQVAEYYRRGRVRAAEMATKGIDDLFLKQGAQMVVDGCSARELNRTLLWRLANVKEDEKSRLRILHSMAGFAPAFGMLGTLMGLARMLFSLGNEGLAEVGAAMGFSMITTVYGLVTAVLILKPIAIKMEQRSRERLAWQQIKYELLLMLFKKEHPIMIREALDALTLGRGVKPETGAFRSSLRLAKVS